MHYQLTYIVPTDAAELSALEKLIANINKIIADAGGVVKKPIVGTEDQITADNSKNAEEMERIKKTQNVRIFKHRLSYPIKHIFYGFYITNIYELADKNQTAAAKKINAEIKLIKEIVRFVNTKYDFDVFSQQARQKEKIKVAMPAENIAKKEEKPVKKSVVTEKEKSGAPLAEKPKSDKKTEIEELDEKLEQILNA